MIFPAITVGLPDFLFVLEALWRRSGQRSTQTSQILVPDRRCGGIKGGQEFLLEVYRSITRVEDVWKRCALIVIYDEHGGFFDHVLPPAQTSSPLADAKFDTAFDSLGVRVPALVVSPFVKSGTVFHGMMDHTSILKFISDVFGRGNGYSPEVDSRSVVSVSKVLNNAAGDREIPVIPSLNPYLDREPRAAGRLQGTAPDTAMQEAFQHALDGIRNHPAKPAGTYDALLAAFPREHP